MHYGTENDWRDYNPDELDERIAERLHCPAGLRVKVAKQYSKNHSAQDLEIEMFVDSLLSSRSSRVNSRHVHLLFRSRCLGSPMKFARREVSALIDHRRLGSVDCRHDAAKIHGTSRSFNSFSASVSHTPEGSRSTAFPFPRILGLSFELGLGHCKRHSGAMPTMLDVLVF
jgi:hypothetical protein